MHWSSKRHAHIHTHHLLSHAVTSPQSHLAAAESAAVASAALGAAAVVVGGCRCCGVPESKAALLSVSSMAARESTSRRPCPSEDCCTKLWICLKWPGSTRQVTTICTDCHTTPKSALCIAWQKCHVWASCMLKLRLHLNGGKARKTCHLQVYVLCSWQRGIKRECGAVTSYMELLVRAAAMLDGMYANACV